MPGLRKTTQLYILTVGVLGLSLLAWTWVAEPVCFDQQLLVTTGAMLAVNLASEHYAIKLPRGGHLAASTITQIASMLILPPPLVLLITASGTIIEDIITRRAWYKTLFNTGQFMLAVGMPALLLDASGSSRALLSPGNAAQGVPLAIAAVVLYYATNTILTNTIIALEQQAPVIGVWLANNSTSVLLEFGMGVIGVLWAYIWLLDPLWSFLAVLPAIMTWRAFSHIRRLEDENEQGILAIAETIDARDPYTFQHSIRVAQYTEKIAKALHLNPLQVDQLISAARLHDLGKLGISNEVLHKRGELNAEDWATMRRHPEIGARILGRYQLYREGADCVLHHHERYDGTGYPRGLRGEEIPLGARILAVADAYEAMTSDRPYRRALSAEKAKEELKLGMGTQFDPTVVAAFLKILDREAPATSLGLVQDIAERRVRKRSYTRRRAAAPLSDETASQFA